MSARAGRRRMHVGCINLMCTSASCAACTQQKSEHCQSPGRPAIKLKAVTLNLIIRCVCMCVCVHLNVNLDVCSRKTVASLRSRARRDASHRVSYVTILYMRHGRSDGRAGSSINRIRCVFVLVSRMHTRDIHASKYSEQTLNTHTLARHGMKFKRMCSSPRCSLNGVYPGVGECKTT